MRTSIAGQDPLVQQCCLRGHEKKVTCVYTEIFQHFLFQEASIFTAGGSGKFLELQRHEKLRSMRKGGWDSWRSMDWRPSSFSKGYLKGVVRRGDPLEILGLPDRWELERRLSEIVMRSGRFAMGQGSWAASLT